jgi:hypothetical protein
MTVDPTNPHDSLVKQLLAGPAQAAAVLQTLLLPEIARAVDWSTLRPATREMPAKGRASTHTDLVFRARLAGGAHSVEVLIYVLIEHQSTPDPTMPVRVLAGLTGLWRSWQRNPAGRPLPLVIPLVLAHTEQGWKAPRSMDELLALPLMYAPALARYLPRFDLMLIDLSEAQRDQLARWARTVEAHGARAQAIMLRILVVVRDAEALTRTLQEEAMALEALARDPEAQWTFDLLVSYVLVAGRGMTPGQICDILKHVAPTAAAKMKTVQEMYMDKLRREEMPRLRAEAQAIEKARFEAMAEAKAEAMAEAKAEAMAEAKAEAERDRWREVLRRTLTDKFGRVEPEHERRIETASLEDLQLLFSRAATSDALEAVFAPRDE